MIKLEIVPMGYLSVNCSIISHDDLCVLIDPADNFTELESVLKKRNLTPIAHLYTHGHFDHVGNSKRIKETWNAPFALPKKDLSLYEHLEAQCGMFGTPVNTPGTPDVLFSEGDSIDLKIKDNELSDFVTHLKIFETPGHTPGSCCLYSESFDGPILFAGDTIFQMSIGRTDFPGGNHDDLIRNVKEKILILNEDTKIVTGHGPLTNLKSEKRYNPYFGKELQEF